MELDLKNFHFKDTQEGIVRPIEEKDIDQIVLLHRYLNNRSPAEPIQEEERMRVRCSQAAYCIELPSGEIASCAVSNGIVHKAFQILGVVTHPLHQRKGFAKAVCSHLIRHFQEKEQATRAAIFTGHDNMPAIKCYRSLGFEITREYYFAEFKDPSEDGKRR